MPLVKAGRVVDDRFVRVLDDAPIPDGVPVHGSGGALPRRRAELLSRDAPTGVLWPNNRTVAELEPYLDRLSLVALVFPNLQGRPRLQPGAAACASATAFRGELRADRRVLRDQFLFLVRAGFDAFEVKKTADVEAFARRSRAIPCSISRRAIRASPRRNGGSRGSRRRCRARWRGDEPRPPSSPGLSRRPR